MPGNSSRRPTLPRGQDPYGRSPVNGQPTVPERSLNRRNAVTETQMFEGMTGLIDAGSQFLESAERETLTLSLSPNLPLTNDRETSLANSPSGSTSSNTPSGTSSRTSSEPESDVMIDFFERFPWARGVKIPRKLKWPADKWYFEKRNNGDGMLLDNTIPEPAPIAWINSLISLDIDELGPEDRDCPVCTEPYLVGKTQEMPLVLPCSHVICNGCCYRIFSGFGDSASEGCPICRTKFVDRRCPINTPTGLQQFLEMTDWMLCRMGPLRLDKYGRETWEQVKAYVNEHLEEERRNIRKEIRLRFLLADEMTSSSVVGRLREVLTDAEAKDLQARIRRALVRFDDGRDANRDSSILDEIISALEIPATATE